MAEGDVFRATATFTMPGTTVAQWVWHYVQDTAGQVDYQDLADAIRSNVGQAMNEIEDYVISTVVGDTLALALWDATLKQFDTVAQSDLSGADGGNTTSEMLPHQDAGVCKFFTSVGRSIGKKFIFGLVETSQDESILLSAVVTAIAAFAAQFDGTQTVGGIAFIAGNFNLILELFREYTQVVEANALAGSQLRRRPGIGI